MSKSNGIKSLKQAAKLLNKHAPEGESLAYINPKEARLLRSHGGSGIQTLQGVPTYGAIWDFFKPIVPDFLETPLENIGTSILNRYKDKDAVYKDNKLIERGHSGAGNIFQDAFSVWAALRAKKDKEGLNAAEMEQFNKLNQQMTAAKTEFDVGTDFGAPLKAPTNVPETIEDVSVFKETTGRPDMITTGQAQGGRIGYNLGGIDRPFQGIGALNPRMGYQNAGEVENFNWGGPDVVETANMREEALFNNPIFDRNIQALEKEQTGKFEELVAQEENKKRSDLHMRLNKYQELVDVEDTGGRSIDALIKVAQGHGDNEVVGFLMQFIEETGPLSQNKTLPMGAAYGGRIGAAGGGIMPLLNLGGMEKDYRQDGGFVPIGRKEKADDVPARLSKNEFVFTADAVRAAGGGDIDEGAQRMYNVMKNLEAGGDISEQSQGKG